MKRKPRVRMHLTDPTGNLPSIEGILLSRRQKEYLVAQPSLLVAVGANPANLDSHWVRIPRERVAFYEVL